MKKSYGYFVVTSIIFIVPFLFLFLVKPVKRIKPTMESVKTKMTRKRLFVLLCIICVVIQEGMAKNKVARTVVYVLFI